MNASTRCPHDSPRCLHTAGVTRPSRARRRSLTRLGAKGLVAAAVVAGAACSAAPEGERIAGSESALDPIGAMPATTYRFTLTSTLTHWAVEPPADQTNDTGYVYWAGLGLQSGPLEMDFTSCTLGSARTATVLSACLAGGSAMPGQPLSRTAAVSGANGTLTMAIALDNIEQVNLAPQSTQGPGATLTNIGNGIALYGALSGLVDPASAPFGAVAGIIGGGLSLAGGLIGAKTGGATLSCAGGLLANPVNGNPTPADFMYHTFSGKELAALTAEGPRAMGFNPNISWNGGKCQSNLHLFIQVERVWNDGLAAFPKSADSAVVHREGDVEAFSANVGRNGIQHDWTTGGVTGTWGSELITTNVQPQLGGTTFAPSPTIHDSNTPIASLSRYAGSLDAFYQDSSGYIFWSNWKADNAWVTRYVRSGWPAGNIAAAARTPNNIDLFWADQFGIIRTAYWATGGTSFPSFPLTGAHATSPGAGIAAVSRTPSDLSVFWIGAAREDATQTALWWSNWNGTGWSTNEIPYTTGLAPLGANISAVATSMENLDVFFVGNTGELRVSSLAPRTPGFATSAITRPGVAAPGARLSSVSLAPDAIDVVLVSNYNVERVSKRGGAWSLSVAIPSSPVAMTSANISLVAPDYGTLDVVFHDPFNTAYSAWLAYGAPSWVVTAALPSVPPPCNRTTCSEWAASSNVQCGAISDGCGGSLDCGGCTAGKECSPTNHCVPARCVSGTCPRGSRWSVETCKCVKLTCDCGGVWPSCKTCQ